MINTDDLPTKRQLTEAVDKLDHELWRLGIMMLQLDQRFKRNRLKTNAQRSKWMKADAHLRGLIARLPIEQE